MELPSLEGVAASVPYVALAPHRGRVKAPIVVGWHSTGAPDSEMAMAAALPMAELPAWRVYLGLPLQRVHPPDGPAQGGPDPNAEADFMRRVVQRAVGEFPAALAELRERFTLRGGPIGLLGASAGAAVAQLAGTDTDLDLAAMALVSPMSQDIDALVERRPRPAVLVVVGGDDDERSRDHAMQLWGTLSTSNGAPGRASLVTVPGMGHDVGGSAGSGAARTAHTVRVDALLCDWFRRHLAP
jgi:predicted esterase